MSRARAHRGGVVLGEVSHWGRCRIGGGVALGGGVGVGGVIGNIRGLRSFALTTLRVVGGHPNR